MAATTDVRDAPDQDRYEGRLDDELAGFAAYHRRPGLVAFVHTEVDDRFAGQGVAGAIVRFGLDDARARGEAVLPFCPYVNGWIRQHAEYLDLVPAEHRARFGL